MAIPRPLLLSELGGGEGERLEAVTWEHTVPRWGAAPRPCSETPPGSGHSGMPVAFNDRVRFLGQREPFPGDVARDPPHHRKLAAACGLGGCDFGPQIPT